MMNVVKWAGCILFVILCLAFCAFSNTYAQAIPSTKLINNARDFDGKNVFYRGEAIGEVMARGEYAWVNLNDGENAVGIWVNRNLVKNISFMGGYGAKGDTWEVEGKFHRACVVHGGDLDIHVQSLRLVKGGNKSGEKYSSLKLKVSFGLGAILLLLWTLNLLSVTRKRK